MRLIALVAISGAISATLFAQKDAGVPPPIRAKRLPPEKATIPTHDSGNSFIDRYDFGAQLAVLQGEAAQQPKTVPVRPTPAQPATDVPSGFKPRMNVQLTKTAQEAVQMSEQWMREHNQPAAGPDGRVLYSYGAGLATVVCAPLRVCIIELQAGEKLVGEPNIGDSVRWNLSPALYGKGDSETTLIVLKPQTPGLDTNLLITTDRRAYYLRLVSKTEDYVARVAFSYPADEAERKWQEHLAREKEAQQKATQIAELPSNAVDSLHFNYRLKGRDAVVRPIRVFDDGKKTYIQMSPAVKNREAPVLVVLGSDGKQEMVNYRVKDDMYIVDRLFSRAALILGSGRKARKVEIDRERKS